MARNKPLSKNESTTRNGNQTIDRQMVLPKNIGNSRFPVVFANPKVGAKNPGEIQPRANTHANSPEIPYGTSKQSRY